MTNELITKLKNLADTYEVFSFTNEDPSQFLRWYDLSLQTDVECASFIAAMLSFGNRKQFIPKIKQILTIADQHGGISKWILQNAPDFPKGENKFYRFYSYDDMHCLFNEMSEILQNYNSLGEYFKILWEQNGRCGPQDSFPCPLEGVATNEVGAQGQAPQFIFLDQLISASFPKSAIVPKGKNSANKRIQMFLRWMVRKNSPVDLGIWNWYSAANLLIPLDVHVMQEAAKLGIVGKNAAANRKTAILITNELAQAFPGDPCRGDFALFGLGVAN